MRECVIDVLSFVTYEVTYKSMRINLGAAINAKFTTVKTLGIPPTYPDCIISNGNFTRSN